MQQVDNIPTEVEPSQRDFTRQKPQLLNSFSIQRTTNVKPVQ